MGSLEEKQKLYFVNAWVDGFFLGFLSIGLFLYFRFFDKSGPFSASQWTLAQMMIWATNWPHVFATSCRLYQSQASRRQYPLTTYCLPFLLIFLAVMAFCFPQNFAPYVIKILILWSSFHFSGQTIGLTLLYARRAGIIVSARMRFCVVGFVYCSFLTQLAQLESFSLPVPYSAISFPLLGIPLWTPRIFLYGTHIFLSLLVIEGISSWRKAQIPWIVCLPLVVQYLWFIYGADVYAFQLFVSSLHGLQYLLVAWAMQLSQTASWPQSRPAFFVAAKTVQWALLTLLGGVGLFFLLPLGLSHLGLDFSFCSAVVFAILQFHHFFVDGVIWKLRDERVSRYLKGNVLAMMKAGGATQ